MDLSLQVFLK